MVNQEIKAKKNYRDPIWYGIKLSFRRWGFKWEFLSNIIYIGPTTTKKITTTRNHINNLQEEEEEKQISKKKTFY